MIINGHFKNGKRKYMRMVTTNTCTIKKKTAVLKHDRPRQQLGGFLFLCFLSKLDSYFKKNLGPFSSRDRTEGSPPGSLMWSGAGNCSQWRAFYRASSSCVARASVYSETRHKNSANAQQDFNPFEQQFSVDDGTFILRRLYTIYSLCKLFFWWVHKILLKPTCQSAFRGLL